MEKKSPKFCITVNRSIWKMWPLEIRQADSRREAARAADHCHAFPSNYRHMKYELQLIFLLGVTLCRALRTLGIYLGSKLTSFVGWPAQYNLCSVTGTSLWLLILDICPSQKLTGRGFLNKDWNNAITSVKG